MGEGFDFAGVGVLGGVDLAEPLVQGAAWRSRRAWSSAAVAGRPAASRVARSGPKMSKIVY